MNYAGCKRKFDVAAYERKWAAGGAAAVTSSKPITSFFGKPSAAGGSGGGGAGPGGAKAGGAAGSVGAGAAATKKAAAKPAAGQAQGPPAKRSKTAEP